MKRIKELQDKRGSLREEMKQISNQAATENRLMTTEEETRWNKLDEEFESHTREINRLVKLEKEVSSQEGQEDGEKRSKEQREMESFAKYVQRGAASLTEAEKAELRTTQSGQTTTTTAGGYLIPQGFGNEIIKAMKAFGGVRLAGTVIPTDSGNPLPFPTLDDTSNSGAMLAEETQDSQQLVTLGQTILNAYTMTSKVVPVQVQLLNDSAFSVEQLLNGVLAERIARIENAYMTTGTGSSQPQGVVIGGTNSSVRPAAASVTRANLLDLMHSVDPAYRNSPKCYWMFNDSTLKAIKKLSIGTGDDRPLWQPSLGTLMVDGPADTIEGKPYIINQDMASFGAGNKSILFGDFSRFYIRDVNGFIFVRLNERYMDFLQVGFLMYHRFDSKLMTSAAIKYVVHANT